MHPFPRSDGRHTGLEIPLEAQGLATSARIVPPFLFRVLDRFLGYWLTRVWATDAQIPTISFFLYFLIQLGKILIPILLWLIFCWREISLFPIRSTLPTTSSKKG